MASVYEGYPPTDDDSEDGTHNQNRNMPRPRDTAQRLLATSGRACYYCSMTTSRTPIMRFTPTTTLLYKTPLIPKTMSPIRRYAQAATAPSSEDTADEPPPSRRARIPEAAQYPFPSKKNPSPYEILHLPTTADPKEIKQRYYRLALLYHPDSTHPSSSPHNFSLLNRAYKLLSSPHSRATYHRTGHGWGTAHDVAAGRTGGGSAGGFNRASDEELRRQARARAYSYAYSSGGVGGGGGSAGYGRGGQAYDQARWGGADGQEGGAGGPNPNGNYTTNTRFIGSLLIVSVLFSLIQYNRALNASLWTQELLDAKHMGASQALAEAHHEAALYGRERRERIRRLVRSREVEKDFERRLAEAEARRAETGHAAPAVDLEPEVRNDQVIRDVLKR